MLHESHSSMYPEPSSDVPGPQGPAVFSFFQTPLTDLLVLFRVYGVETVSNVGVATSFLNNLAAGPSGTLGGWAPKDRNMREIPSHRVAAWPNLVVLSHSPPQLPN